MKRVCKILLIQLLAEALLFANACYIEIMDNPCFCYCDDVGYDCFKDCRIPRPLESTCDQSCYARFIPCMRGCRFYESYNVEDEAVWSTRMLQRYRDFDAPNIYVRNKLKYIYYSKVLTEQFIYMNKMAFWGMSFRALLQSNKYI